MTHIPRIDSLNAWCKHCELLFGFVVTANKVSCPECKTAQAFPVISTGDGKYNCLSCNVSFSDAPNTVPTCHECHESWVEVIQ